MLNYTLNHRIDVNSGCSYIIDKALRMYVVNKSYTVS